MRKPKLTPEEKELLRLEQKEDKQTMKNWLDFMNRMEKKDAFVKHSLEYGGRNPIFTKRNIKTP